MKKLFSMLLVSVMALSLVACSSSDTSSTTTTTESTTTTEAATTETASSGESYDLTFSTGGDQGTYYGFGSVLAGQVSGATNTTVTAITSGGSAANIDALDMGDAQMAFCQSDVMAYAYDGIGTYADLGAVTGFSTVAALYLEEVQIVTCDPSITTVADLAGKNVSIGASGSGVYFNAIDILGAYGLTEDDINATYEDFGNSTDSLLDGKIDAAFVVAGAPTTSVTSLSTSKQVYLVSIEAEYIDALLAASPYYTAVTITADTYGLDEDASTVAVGAVVIARDDVADEAIYDFVSTIYNNPTTDHAKGAALDLDFAASVTAVPYHAGAAAYFAEQGIEVATK
ncbi:TAXI family TRAP transporter solute-binding subunit [Bengtsoniella intestinalis]|uniref:TAXI family TRAP transporter solute-binding subunit n=1 Tax=Bengtsoniella intestinalis TaxID=3073143 RepID=UPI00391EF834